MKKSNLNAWVLALLSLWLLAACSGKKNTPSHVSYLPADADFAVAIDLRRLISKSLQPGELFSEKNLKEMGASEKEAKETSQKFERILNSGIDYANTFYIFGKEKNGFVGIVLPLDDASKWNKSMEDPEFWKKVFEEEQPKRIRTKGNVKYFEKSDDASPTVVAWNDEVVLIGIMEKGYYEKQDKKSDALMEKVLELPKLPKEKQLIEQEKSFKQALAEAEDLTVWVNLNAASGLDAVDEIEEEAKQYLKDAFFTVQIAFENGLIRSDATFIPSEKTRKEMQLYYNVRINKSVSKIPYKKPLALLSFTISEVAINKIKEKQLLTEANEDFSQQLGISADEFMSMWDGQFCMALNSLGAMGLPEMAVSMGIRDEKLYQRMVDYMLSKGMLVKKNNAEGDVYLIAGGMAHLYKDENYLRLAMGASETIWKAAAVPEEWGDQMKKASSFVGIRADLLTQLAQLSWFKGMNATEVVQLINELVIWSPGYDDGKIKGQVLLSFREEDKNALLILIDAIKAEAKKKENRYKEEPMASDKRLPMELEEVDEEAAEEVPAF